MVLVVSLQLKLLTVWILTGSSGLVLPLGSDWMGASGFYARIFWSGLVSGCKRFGLVWIGMVRSLTQSSHKEPDLRNKTSHSHYKILSKLTETCWR